MVSLELPVTYFINTKMGKLKDNKGLKAKVCCRPRVIEGGECISCKFLKSVGGRT